MNNNVNAIRRIISFASFHEFGDGILKIPWDSMERFV